MFLNNIDYSKWMFINWSPATGTSWMSIKMERYYSTYLGFAAEQ